MKHLRSFTSFASPLSALSELYAGSKAANTKKRKRRFDTARELARQGVEMEEIRQRTGWFKGRYDDKWRLELSDATLNVKVPCFNDVDSKRIVVIASLADPKDQVLTIRTTLGEVLQNTSLFQEYPELRKMTTIFRSKDSENLASYDPQNLEIILNNVNMERLRAVRALVRYEPQAERTTLAKRKPLFFLTSDHLDTLVHEVQHAIQEIEEFYSGGSPNMFDDKEQAKDLDGFVIQFMREHPDLEKASLAMRRTKLAGEGSFAARQAQAAFDELSQKYGLDQAIAEYSASNPKEVVTGYKQYLALAGEIESRDVEKRRTLNNKKGTYALITPKGKVQKVSDDEKEILAFKKKNDEEGNWKIRTTLKSKEVEPYNLVNASPHRAKFKRGLGKKTV